jgi:putative ABC transport system ATP-binding protein
VTVSICELRDVTKEYGTGDARVAALKGVSLAVEPGEFTVISGPSGSGKTTLFNLVGCLDKPTRGTVRLEDHDVVGLSAGALAKLRARRIGFVFQSFNLIPVFTAVENVELALQLAGDNGSDRRARAQAALAEVGLADLAHRRPNQLSGGQQQRVAIARALVKRPALVIADEPTANLDSKTGEAVVELMRSMNQKLGATFLFSTHDPAVMAHAQREVKLHDGEIVDDVRHGAA